MYSESRIVVNKNLKLKQGMEGFINAKNVRCLCCNCCLYVANNKYFQPLDNTDTDTMRQDVTAPFALGV